MTPKSLFSPRFFGFLLTIILIAAAGLSWGNSALPTKAQTDKPAPTPSTTALPHIQLPAWMRDPDAAVIVLFTNEGATFINAETDERFPLGLSYVRGVAWVDAEDGVYIQLKRPQSRGADNSEGFNEFIKLDMGRLIRLPLRDTRAPTNRPPAPVVQANGRGDSFELVAQAEWELASGQQDTYLLRTFPNVVIHAANGRSIRLYGSRRPIPGLTQFTVQWFADGELLGIWYTTREDGVFSDTVELYDANGNWQASFDDLGLVRWSAHHGKMLFRNRSADNAVCVAYFYRERLRDQNCDFLTDWQSANHAEIRDYQWSDDGQKIIFTAVDEDRHAGRLCIADPIRHSIKCPLERSITRGIFSGFYQFQPGNVYGVYRYSGVLDGDDRLDRDIPRETGLCLVREDDYKVDCISDRILPADTYYNTSVLSPDGKHLAVMYTGQGNTRNDGVCIANLQSGEVKCPNISLLERKIDTYSWSPDSRFFLIMYNSGGPSSDDKTFTQFSIINAADGSHRDGGDTLYEYDFSQLWRPALAP